MRMRGEALHILAQIGAIGNRAELVLHIALGARGFGGEAGQRRHIVGRIRHYGAQPEGRKVAQSKIVMVGILQYPSFSMPSCRPFTEPLVSHSADALKEKQVILLPHGVVRGTGQIDEDLSLGAKVGVQVAHAIGRNLLVVLRP